MLEQERKNGQGKLKDNVPEIVKSEHGREYFVDGKIVYLPEKGDKIIVGDIHGDPESIIAILEQTGFIENMEEGDRSKKIIFMGDITGRGEEDIKALDIVMDLKNRYPNNVVFLRGNHEEKDFSFLPFTTKRFSCLLKSLKLKFNKEMDDNNFVDKCWREDDIDSEKINVSMQLLRAYNNLFENLPGILVFKNIALVHGGIPNKDIESLKDLNNEEKLKEMRWNDPDEEIKEREPSNRAGADEDFTKFGKEAFKRFINTIGIKLLGRSHQHQLIGMKRMFDLHLATIFSTGSIKSKGYYKDLVLNPRFIVIPDGKEIEFWEDEYFKAVDYERAKDIMRQLQN